jgi:cell wall-associated NlpC family hydrolase
MARTMRTGRTVPVGDTAPSGRRPRLRTFLPAPALALLAALAPAAAAHAAAPTLGNWDASQQRQVAKAGLMTNIGGSFDGAASLGATQANAAMAALSARLERTAPESSGSEQQAVEPGTGETNGTSGAQEEGASSVTSFQLPVVRTARNPVTLVTFDRMVVEQLGLRDVAAHVQSVAQAAGLRPPYYFGTEVVARFLELRYDHPAGTDRLELFPTDPITRAEAAWSLARAMQFDSWNIGYAREALSAFALPHMSSAQLQALQVAVSRIGYPYVWGGTTDNTADRLEHGGFDCSGFAWRVFKVSGLPWGNEIQGRTAAEQAGEIPLSQRLRSSQLAPGDLLFFGHAHFRSKATEQSIVHEGIYLGNNWVIHSSSQGVYVLPLMGSWLGSQFAWGRRVIH